MADANDHVASYFSALKWFQVEDPDRIKAEIAKLPTDYVVWACSLLNYLLQSGPRGLDVQELAIDSFVPPERRNDVRQAVREGELFIREECLLVVMRLAIEFGKPGSPPDTLPEGEREAFFWAVALAGDAYGSEWIVTGNEKADMAANALRGLASSGSDPYANYLARASAMWLDLPMREDLKKDPHYVDIAAVFEQATGGTTLVGYFAVVMGLFAHSQTLVKSGAKQSLFEGWAFDPRAWFAASGSRERAIAAAEYLSAERDWYLKEFKELGDTSKYSGIAMVPMRFRPVYRLTSGKMVTLSERYLVEGVINVVYWTIRNHLAKDQGQSAAVRFEQFFGKILESYVTTLVGSATSNDGTERVFPESEAVPPQGAPDAMAFLGERNLAIEVTKQQLRYEQTLLAGSLEEFERDLTRTADKVVQLVCAARRFQNGDIRFEGHDSAEERGRALDRLLVILEPIPRWPGGLNERTRAAFAKVGADPESLVISVGELEVALGRTDPTRLVGLLHDWRADPGMSEVSFHDYLGTRLKVVDMDERPPYLTQVNRNLEKSIREELALPPDTVVGPDFV